MPVAGTFPAPKEEKYWVRRFRGVTQEGEVHSTKVMPFEASVV